MGKTGPKPKSLSDAWAHLCATKTVDTNGCWRILYGYAVGIGYKRIRADGMDYYNHQVAFIITNGREALKGNPVIRHTCDVPDCINPNHLVAGSHADNIRDKMERGRQPTGTQIYCSKINEATAIAILKERRELMTSYKDLATKYGLTRGGVFSLVSGHSWKHLDRTGIIVRTRREYGRRPFSLEGFNNGN